MKCVFFTSLTGPGNGYVHDVSNMQHMGFDFVVFHDGFHAGLVDGLRKSQPHFKGWRAINIDAQYPFDINQFPHKQRYVRAMPQLFLEGYDYSVYLDPKWVITESFLTLCQQLIAQQPGWLVPRHPTRTSLYQEFLFPYANGSLSLAECIKVIDTLKARGATFDNWVSTLSTWIIRRHDRANHEIGQRWFELIQACYQDNVRDQILLPFAALDTSQLDRNLGIEQMYRCGVSLNYVDHPRVRQVNWQSGAQTLLSHLYRVTGVAPG